MHVAKDNTILGDVGIKELLIKSAKTLEGFENCSF